MVAVNYTVAFHAAEARPVEVQCAVAPGLASFQIIGLANKAVSEAHERVRAALDALSIALPSKRITVNLSPADMPKERFTFRPSHCGGPPLGPGHDPAGGDWRLRSHG